MSKTNTKEAATTAAAIASGGVYSFDQNEIKVLQDDLTAIEKNEAT